MKKIYEFYRLVVIYIFYLLFLHIIDHHPRDKEMLSTCLPVFQKSNYEPTIQCRLTVVNVIIL